MLKLTMRCFRRQSLSLKTGTISLLVFLLIGAPAYLPAQDKAAAGSASAQVAKAVGTIKSIHPDSIIVASESGAEVTAQLSASTKILRIPPGEKDLKNATVLQVQDLQTGDRVLVRGPSSANGDGHTIAALAVIVMKQADVAAIHQHELDEWHKQGVGGLVTEVDAADGVITVSSGGLGTKRNITVNVAKDTILRRYAPGSVKFDDAKPAPIDQIKVGDQLLARGSRNADGSEVKAEEIVSGTFRSIAGTIKAVDAANNTVTVQDVIAKSAVVVKVSPDSQMWKLPAEMAQRFAMRLKNQANDGSGDHTGRQSQGEGVGGGQRSGAAAGTTGTGTESPAGRGAGGNGPPDLQRMLSRLPSIKLADLQKDDVVYILATEGGSSDGVMASKVVAGVEPILTAAPNRSASSLLAPWSLGTTGGEGEGAQ
jgi:hypothetical protein